MLKIKYFFKQNRMIILIACIILICSIAIAFGVYAQVTNKSMITEKKEEEEKNYEALKSSFKDIFTNNINKQETADMSFDYDEIIYCKYNIQTENSGKYNIDAKVPLFKIENEVTAKINKEIFDTFARKIIDIINNATVHTTYNLDYVAYVNENILSLIIKCNYKNGSNPQRIMIQTYNYDLQNNKLLNIEEILNYKNLNKEEVESKISSEIKSVNSQMKSIHQQGYNVYIRDEEADIYKIENTTNFFLGEKNYLYLIYAYGNNNYTSDMDLIIF
ncbi:MAG: hypothetical protein Q4G09_05435 [Clostridia bacterium]|nr:hypothetical protein [Clostridia bacterium]